MSHWGNVHATAMTTITMITEVELAITEGVEARAVEGNIRGAEARAEEGNIKAVEGRIKGVEAQAVEGNINGVEA
jgi:DUF4097 and DUF4098 domain-containing protein YvlB